MSLSVDVRTFHNSVLVTSVTVARLSVFTIAGASLVSLTTTMVQAETLKAKGTHKYKQGELKEAISLYKQAAERHR